MNKGIYQHFSIEDRPFLDKGMEWIKKVEDSYAPFLTPFINPHQEKLLKILAKTYDLACSSSGEFVSSEYVRVLLYPDYFQPEFSAFEMSLQEIVYSNKFEHLTHAKILGTVINQLGIERKLFGDILVDEERAQIMINQQFLLLFQDGLKKIGRIPVSLEERPFTEKIDKLEQYRELDLSVSSFRLDVLLSNVLKLSRNQANQLIDKKLVQVNYHVVDKSDYTVQVGDLISVRKFGRLRLLQDKGQTKKEKKKITVQLLLSK
mgnify:FL=1